MKKFLGLLGFVLFLAAPVSAVPATERSLHMVRYVVDGDTLVLEDGRKVRLIGVDTPEIHDDYHRNAAHAEKMGKSPRLVDEFALKAREFTRQAVDGKPVRLEYGWEPVDKYGRTLAYVYRVADDLFLNAELIRQGYGFAYTRFPFKHEKEFRSYETEARRNRRGLWK